ncbi:MAG: GTPase Era [Deltaproteobacteria bacterium]|jgi:GTP-binding protein Era|nr:GTPase Era [Deltaproteobacteria bacterium]
MSGPSQDQNSLEKDRALPERGPEAERGLEPERAPESERGPKAQGRTRGSAKKKKASKADDPEKGERPESGASKALAGQAQEGFRSGFVAIVGAPNAGKSSLMNSLIGHEVAIVNAKPQTTRHRILGVMPLEGAQIAFVDTPGIHQSGKLLNQALLSRAKAAMADADVCLWLIDGAFQGSDHQEAARLVSERGDKPLVAAINKSDVVENERLSALAEEIEREFKPGDLAMISALTGKNTGKLVKSLASFLPLSPPLFDEDALTDQSYRAIAAEYIREAVFELTRQEIPYSTAVTIDSFKEPGDGGALYRVEATIHVERESQKRMVIGRHGLMLKRVGERARLRLEGFLGGKVFLSLFVRQTKDWTANPRLIEEFGYGDR